MIDVLRRWFPVGSPAWSVYRVVRYGSRPKAPGHVIHGNILLPRERVIYCYVPKVACSTLKKICADALGLETTADAAETVHDLPFPYAKKYKIRTEFAGHYKFAFVRNPWDRLVSCYLDKVCDEANAYRVRENRFTRYLSDLGVWHEGLSFEEFVDIVAAIPDRRAEGHFRSQSSLLTDGRGLLPFDAIGRFETFAEDFEIIAKRAGLAASPPHLRRTGRRDYREYYSVRMRETIRRRYEEDCALFVYDF